MELELFSPFFGSFADSGRRSRVGREEGSAKCVSRRQVAAIKELRPSSSIAYSWVREAPFPSTIAVGAVLGCNGSRAGQFGL